ncbi:MAG: ferritin family protein, partial [Oscillospiraceae bacterium]
MNIKGTKSEGNLRTALAGESMARNKYTYYAQQAKQEGKDDIAELYTKMAENEMNHAKVWFKLLNNGVPKTIENLQDSMKGENSEWMTMYPNFAKQARQDGLEELAQMFEKVANIETAHEKRFMEEYIKLKMSQGEKVAAPVQETTKTAEPAWRCAFCGYTHKANGAEPLAVCPVCEAIGAFEKVLA